jgi:hypothetical protein
VSRVEASFRRRVDQLPEETQRLLLLGAAEPTGDPMLLWRAAAVIGLRIEAAAPAEAADLIAVGRQAQFNPNIAQHWAHDLGINGKFEDWTPEYGWWLEKRTRTIEAFATPTGIVKRHT